MYLVQRFSSHFSLPCWIIYVKKLVFEKWIAIVVVVVPIKWLSNLVEWINNFDTHTLTGVSRNEKYWIFSTMSCIPRKWRQTEVMEIEFEYTTDNREQKQNLSSKREGCGDRWQPGKLMAYRYRRNHLYISI